VVVWENVTTCGEQVFFVVLQFFSSDDRRDFPCPDFLLLSSEDRLHFPCSGFLFLSSDDRRDFPCPDFLLRSSEDRRDFPCPGFLLRSSDDRRDVSFIFFAVVLLEFEVAFGPLVVVVST
jgi:hypothetical protein